MRKFAVGEKEAKERLTFRTVNLNRAESSMSPQATGSFRGQVAVTLLQNHDVSSPPPRTSFEKANATYDQTKRKFDAEPPSTRNKQRLSRRLEYLERCMDDTMEEGHTFYERENNENVEN
jgi:hypothetical protein